MEHEHHHDEVQTGEFRVHKPQRTIADYLPLIVAAGAVVILTMTTLLFSDSITLMDAMRYFMGYFFLVFGGFKVIKWSGFVEAYSTYDLIAMRSKVYAYIYPFIELSLAALYLAGLYLFYANVVTLIIMSIGAVGVYLKLRDKEEIPCACLGAVFKVPMTYVTLFEDLLMAAMAASMLVWSL